MFFVICRARQQLILTAVFILSLLLFASAVSADPYDDFNTFCIENFGAEKEALAYETFGSTLQFVESGSWMHESQNSAAIGFETNLPSKSYVEYGESSAYGQQTALPDRHHYLHLHYLKGLAPETTYHYRLVVQDERGNILRSADKTLRTRNFSGAVAVPGTMGSPPYVLDQPNTTYIVTGDISADTRAFTIAAAGVILDLNGHTITYDQGEPILKDAQWNDYVYSSESTFGIYSYGPYLNSKVLNGTVKQGATNSQGHISLGFNPVYISTRGEGVFEVAGITVEYSGHSVGGIIARYGNQHVHNNVIIDRGSGIDNRHQGIKAMWIAGQDPVHHNLIKRTRHQGIIPSGTVQSNEVYVDSWATNSFGVKPVTQVSNNRIFGMGYHVVAIGWSSDITVNQNYIHLQGTAPTDRSGEYGDHCSVNGIRLTQYGGATAAYENNLYSENTIVVKGREGCGTMRGVQFSSDPHVKNLVFRNNTIKTEVQDQLTPIAPCVVGHGLHDRSDQQLPIIYKDNTFITNSVHVRFGDNYASGGNHRFLNNRFIKFGNHPDYHTIRVGYWIQDTYNNAFFDSQLEGGADLENSIFSGSGKRDYSVGHSLHIKALDTSAEPISNQIIEVFDNTGKAFEGQTDADGYLRLELLEYTYAADTGATQASKTERSNHQARTAGYQARPITGNLFAVRNTEETPITLTFFRDDQEPDYTAPEKPGNLRIQ